MGDKGLITEEKPKTFLHPFRIPIIADTPIMIECESVEPRQCELVVDDEVIACIDTPRQQGNRGILLDFIGAPLHMELVKDTSVCVVVWMEIECGTDLTAKMPVIGLGTVNEPLSKLDKIPGGLRQKIVAVRDDLGFMKVSGMLIYADGKVQYREK